MSKVSKNCGIIGIKLRKIGGHGAEIGSLEGLRRVGTNGTIGNLGRIRKIGINGINGIDGIDGKFPSSEALPIFPIKRSVTHRALALPSILSRGRKGIKGY